MVKQSAQTMGVVRAKNARQKRKLKKEEPKVFENTKNTVLIKGGNVSNTLTQVMHDFHRLKQPNSIMYKKKNIVRPFEDVSSIEFFSQKSDAALFCFGSHNKKRPDNLVIGRLFDHQILDMIELGVKNYKQMSGKCGIALGTKPILSFAGDQWESEITLKDQTQIHFKKIRNLFLDFFRGENVTNIRLKGLELFIQLTLIDGIIAIRTYQVKLLKSGLDQPRIELESIGPDMDLELRRTQFGSEELMKKAMKVPPEAKLRLKKNILVNDITKEKTGTVHLGRQNLDELQRNTKKQKALVRPMPEKEIDSEDEKEFEEDVEMEEL